MIRLSEDVGTLPTYRPHCKSIVSSEATPRSCQLSIGLSATNLLEDAVTAKGGHLNITATRVPATFTVASATPTSSSPLPSALQRACLAAKIATENKGDKVLVLDLREITPEFDYFVIASGASRRQVHTIVEEVDAVLRGVGDVRQGITGYEGSKWVVQDYGDILVHVFDPDTRDYYRLEEKWEDGEVVDWQREID
jgi:ribosome-associated protein